MNTKCRWKPRSQIIRVILRVPSWEKNNPTIDFPCWLKILWLCVVPQPEGRWHVAAVCVLENITSLPTSGSRQISRMHTAEQEREGGKKVRYLIYSSSLCLQRSRRRRLFRWKYFWRARLALHITRVSTSLRVSKSKSFFPPTRALAAASKWDRASQSVDVTDETPPSDDIWCRRRAINAPRSVPACTERTDVGWAIRPLPFRNKEEHACCAILPVLRRVQFPACRSI